MQESAFSGINIDDLIKKKLLGSFILNYTVGNIGLISLCLEIFQKFFLLVNPGFIKGVIHPLSG